MGVTVSMLPKLEGDLCAAGSITMPSASSVPLGTTFKIKPSGPKFGFGDKVTVMDVNHSCYGMDFWVVRVHTDAGAAWDPYLGRVVDAYTYDLEDDPGNSRVFLGGTPEDSIKEAAPPQAYVAGGGVHVSVAPGDSASAIATKTTSAVQNCLDGTKYARPGVELRVLHEGHEVVKATAGGSTYNYCRNCKLEVE
jgi:hypothetical protein